MPLYIKKCKRFHRKGNVLPEDISSIGISTAMHALIAVDENGAPLTRSIIWADNRSTKQAEDLLQHMNGHDIYRLTDPLSVVG